MNAKGLNTIELFKSHMAQIKVNYIYEALLLLLKKELHGRQLAKELKKLILKDNGVSQNTVTFLNARHLECLQRAGEALKRSLSIIKQGSSPDLLALDIKAAILALREVSGAEVSDEVINEVFDQFCVGK